MWRANREVCVSGIDQPKPGGPSKCRPLGRVSTDKKVLVPNSSLLGHFGMPEKSFLRHYSNLLFRSADFGTITQWIHFPIEGDPFSHPSGSSARPRKSSFFVFSYIKSFFVFVFSSSFLRLTWAPASPCMHEQGQKIFSAGPRSFSL